MRLCNKTYNNELHRWLIYNVLLSLTPKIKIKIQLMFCILTTLWSIMKMLIGINRNIIKQNFLLQILNTLHTTCDESYKLPTILSVLFFGLKCNNQMKLVLKLRLGTQTSGINYEKLKLTLFQVKLSMLCY